MMNSLLLILDVILMLHSVLCSLPAPVNVFVDSHNFHNVLRWDPGNGTPPGTMYTIIKRVDRKRETIISNKTSLELLLDRFDSCEVTVQALYKKRVSPPSKVNFSPFKDTKIGPAELSLTGCGNCIQICISMPEPDWRSGLKDLQKFYDPLFKIRWRKAEEAPTNYKVIETYSKNFTLDKLEAGEEYCVQVHIKIRTNNNTLASSWTCTFTSLVEVSRDYVILGAVTPLLILVVGILMIFTFCLYYTGFLCKLQTPLPIGLMPPLSQGYTLTPEKTNPDLTSVIYEAEKQRTHNNLTSHAASRDSNEEEEEEEEEGTNNYLNRNAQHFSGESSYIGTNVSENCTPANLGNSGSLKETSSAQVEEPHAEFEIGVIQGGLDHDDCTGEGATISLMPEEGQAVVEEHITGEQEDNQVKVKACDSSGNVNLFSVTIAVLTASVEQEQNTRDTLKLYELETPLDTVSKLTLNNTDPQATESDHRIIMASAYPTYKDLTETGYQGRHVHTEEEEEVEFSGSMAHP